MAKGISLHIGLNYVDPDAYGGWDGALAGCVNDANDMKAVAASRNFSTTILTNAEATSAKVISEISNAAKALQSGDIFFISYSGHGGQIPDEEGNESDGFDETWVLYDREVIDNELYRLWSQFKTGVRIIVISDSCHSGTIVKMFLRNQPGRRQTDRTFRRFTRFSGSQCRDHRIACPVGKHDAQLSRQRIRFKKCKTDRSGPEVYPL